MACEHVSPAAKILPMVVLNHLLAAAPRPAFSTCAKKATPTAFTHFSASEYPARARRRQMRTDHRAALVDF
jgi:hypothetical protein